MSTVKPAVAPTSSVYAGVVTFNPDLKRLEENLASIVPQVEKTLLFDNGSTNFKQIATLVETRCASCDLFDGKDNRGLAYALNRLCRQAADEGAGSILLLDQDSVAGVGMVASMLPYREGNTAIVSPIIIDRNIPEEPNSEFSSKTVKRAITSGSLVDLDAFAMVGGFDERLFVDWVDFDFCANLRRNGFEIVKTSQASLLHEMGKRTYAFKIPWIDKSGRIAAKACYRTNHATSRRIDKARSWAIVMEKYRQTKVGRDERRFIALNFLRDLCLEKGKAGVVSATLSGMRDGRRAVRHSERKIG